MSKNSHLLYHLLLTVGMTEDSLSPCSEICHLLSRISSKVADFRPERNSEDKPLESIASSTSDSLMWLIAMFLLTYFSLA